MPMLLFILAYGLMIIGGIVMLVAAFRESVLWGLACFFLPVVSLVFLFVHWDEAKKGFGLQVVGLVVLGVAMVIAPGTHSVRH